MGSAVIVEADPVANDTGGVLDTFETVSMCALFFQFSITSMTHGESWRSGAMTTIQSDRIPR